jgi:hypothetical protein
MKIERDAPLHPPYRGALGRALRPLDMTQIKLPNEVAEGMQRISLSIFTDCSNAGRAFAECLSAIYMSGLHHGQELSKQ